MEPLNKYEIAALLASFDNGDVTAPVGSLWMDTAQGFLVMVLVYANIGPSNPVIVYQDLKHGQCHVITVKKFLSGEQFMPMGHVWDRSKA